MGRGGARSGGVRASPGRARPDALFNAWPWGNNLRPFGPAALQWSSPRPRCWELVPIHDVQALLKTKGNPAGTPAPPEQHPLKRRSLFGAVGCQRNRPADGNSCTLFNEACPRSATSTAPGLDAQSSKDGKRCGLWLTFRVGGSSPARRWIPCKIIHANTTDIQSCGFGRRIPFAVVGCFREGAAGGVRSMAATWLILPVVICLSQRLSHACLSIS